MEVLFMKIIKNLFIVCVITLVAQAQLAAMYCVMNGCIFDQNSNFIGYIEHQANGWYYQGVYCGPLQPQPVDSYAGAGFVYHGAAPSQNHIAYPYHHVPNQPVARQPHILPQQQGAGPCAYAAPEDAARNTPRTPTPIGFRIDQTPSPESDRPSSGDSDRLLSPDSDLSTNSPFSPDASASPGLAVVNMGAGHIVEGKTPSDQSIVAPIPIRTNSGPKSPELAAERGLAPLPMTRFRSIEQEEAAQPVSALDVIRPVETSPSRGRGRRRTRSFSRAQSPATPVDFDIPISASPVGSRSPSPVSVGEPEAKNAANVEGNEIEDLRGRLQAAGFGAGDAQSRATSPARGILPVGGEEDKGLFLANDFPSLSPSPARSRSVSPARSPSPSASPTTPRQRYAIVKDWTSTHHMILHFENRDIDIKDLNLGFHDRIHEQRKDQGDKDHNFPDVGNYLCKGVLLTFKNQNNSCRNGLRNWRNGITERGTRAVMLRGTLFPKTLQLDEKQPTHRDLLAGKLHGNEPGLGLVCRRLIIFQFDNQNRIVHKMCHKYEPPCPLCPW